MKKFWNAAAHIALLAGNAYLSHRYPAAAGVIAPSLGLLNGLLASPLPGKQLDIETGKLVDVDPKSSAPGDHTGRP